MLKIYREPNRWRRMLEKAKAFYEDRMLTDIEFQGHPFKMLRIRYWPIVAILIWLVFNAVMIGVVIAGKGAGTPDPILFAPLYWIFG